jgi:hypothetical protein
MVISSKGGVRGKYYKRAMAGTNLVLIERDLAKPFPDTDTARCLPDRFFIVGWRDLDTPPHGQRLSEEERLTKRGLLKNIAADFGAFGLRVPGYPAGSIRSSLHSWATYART